MLGTGLRNVECRSFPVDYVFNSQGKRQNIRIQVALDPDDMDLKNNKPRTIYMSWGLMMDLHHYLMFGEGALRINLYLEKQGTASPFVFLNKFGDPFNEHSLSTQLSRLWDDLGFYVTPHMLRTPTLQWSYRLRSKDGMEIPEAR